MILVFLLVACGGGTIPTPTASVPSAEQTALARLTVTPGSTAQPPAATAARSPSPSPLPATVPLTVNVTGTPGATIAVTPVSVTETPGLKALAGGTTYTNAAKTYRIDVPPDWSPPAPDPAQPARVITRAPKDALTLTIEEGAAPDNWPRLTPQVIAGALDAAYRQNAPGSILQATTLTGVRGVNDAGLPTYHFVYSGTASGAPAIIERFVTLTLAGAITITTSAVPDADVALRATVEGIVGSLVPLRLDVPTPAALAPASGGGTVLRTPSGLSVALPTGWAAIASPAMPPGIEFAAQNASGDQRVRVIRKTVSEGTKLNDFAATVAGELKGTASAYEVEAEGMNTIGGAPAIRNLYRATIGGTAIVGQSVALIRGTSGYVVSVEVPAGQYDAKPDDVQALFDRIEGSVTLP